MDKDSFVKYTTRSRFSPFVLHLSDGQTLRVQHPEILVIGEECLGVSMEARAMHVVAFDQIVSIQFG